MVVGKWGNRVRPAQASSAALSDQAQLQQVSLHEPLDCCSSRLDDLEGCYEQSCIMIDPGI